MAESSLDNIKGDIKSMLRYMEDRPEEFDVGQVNYYKEQLDKCNESCSAEVLYTYVLALLNDWVIWLGECVVLKWLKKLNSWFTLDVKEDSQDKPRLSTQAKDNRESLKEQCKDSVELASEKIFEVVHENILEAVKKGESSYLTFIYNFNRDIGGVNLNNIEIEVLEQFILNKLKELYSDYFYVSINVGSGNFSKSLSVYVSWQW